MRVSDTAVLAYSALGVFYCGIRAVSIRFGANIVSRIGDSLLIYRSASYCALLLART